MAAPYFFESKDFGAMIVSLHQVYLGNNLPVCFHAIFNTEIALFPSSLEIKEFYQLHDVAQMLWFCQIPAHGGFSAKGLP